MTEDFLYYIWQYKNFNQSLQTVDGIDIEIVHPGILNTDSGPDFSSANIIIGGTEWHGNVEMHIKSSDWLRHHHSEDSAYDSVILHVVYEHDMEIKTKGGDKLEVLDVKGKFKINHYSKYKQLMAGRDWIPCAPQLGKLNDMLVYSWLDRLLIQRLEYKTKAIEQSLKENNNNWEQTFYISLARNFGFNTNSDAFEQLAKSTPIEVIAKYKDSIFQVEALLFGQSSLINPVLDDKYSQQLLSEYDFLKNKHGLRSVYSYQWKFMRMRPVNFPTVRIAQFADLIHKSSHLFSKIISIKKLDELQLLFDLKVSDYWQEHYVFGKKTKLRKKNFGKLSFNLILINTIVPFLFVYANHHGDDSMKERALMFLQHTNAENNSIVKRFYQDGIKAHNAAQSQALIELKNNYCNNIKCLSCNIGLSLLRS